MTAVAAGEVLKRLAALRVTRWNYIDDSPQVQHLGPMAQDFRAAFGLGTNDRRINLVDANGVVMLAIQGLHQEVKALRGTVRSLRNQNGKLRRQMIDLRRQVSQRGESPR